MCIYRAGYLNDQVAHENDVPLVGDEFKVSPILFRAHNVMPLGYRSNTLLLEKTDLLEDVLWRCFGGERGCS